MKERLIVTARRWVLGAYSVYVNLALTLMVVASARADDCSGPGDCGAAPGNIAGATGIAAVAAIVGILAGVQALRGRLDSRDDNPCRAYLDAVNSGEEKIKALEASRDAARSHAGATGGMSAFLPDMPAAAGNAPTRTVLGDKLRGLLQPAAPAPAPVSRGDALQAAEAALAAERAAQAHRVAALTACEKQAGIVPLTAAALQSAIDDAKKHFEDLQQELNGEVAKQLSDLARFDADYNDKWAQAMKGSEDYMNRYPELLRGLEQIWEQFGNREWAKAVAEQVDMAIKVAQAGMSVPGLAKGLMTESVEVAQIAARSARAEANAARSAAREALGKEVQALQAAEQQASKLRGAAREALGKEVQAAERAAAREASEVESEATAQAARRAEREAAETAAAEEKAAAGKAAETPTGRAEPRDPKDVGYDEIPKSPKPKEGRVTEYDEHAPYEDDPLIDHATGKPKPTDEPAGGGPLGPAGMRNPLDQAHVEIEAAEREARRMATMGKDAPGKDTYVEQMHRQYERGLDRARNNLRDAEFRERIDPASLRKLEDAVKPENARSLEDFRRSAGMDPAAPPLAPAAHPAGEPPVRPPERAHGAWTDAETGGRRAPPASEPPARTGPGETQRLDPKESPGSARPSPKEK